MNWKTKSVKTKTAIVAAGGGLTTAAMVTASLFIGMTTQQGSHMTAQFEGLALKNYIDVVGVETWCYGETQMGRLDAGYTKEYCTQLFNSRYPQYAAKVYACYDDTAKKYVTPKMHAAFTDVAFNTGATCNTGMIRNLKQGRPIEACDFILKYKRAGGKDCSVRSNNCYGVYDRRLKFHKPCVEDAKQLPPEGIE